MGGLESNMNINFVLNKMKILHSYIRWGMKLRNLNKKKAYFFGIPTHSNIGDSAIVLAETEFLKTCGYKRIVEITSQEYVSYRKCIKRLLPKKATIFLPGGGNMGSLWPVEEERRCQIIEDFKKHSIFVFPQTVYYGNSQKDIELKNRTMQIYNSAHDMTIVAREEVSYHIMKELYPNCKIFFTPDIVLSMGRQKFNQNRQGILLCFRDDKERKLSSAQKENFILALKQDGWIISLTDTLSDGEIQKVNRKKIVEEKMKQIASSRIFITDRLHGMIFAAITETPCIVLANNHYKVSGTYKWLNNLNYIRFASDLDEAKKLIPALLAIEHITFQIDDKYYDELKKHILKNTY